MFLYWGMFTVGFLFGSILAFVTFAPKKPEEDDVEYDQGEIRDYKALSGAIESNNNLSEMIFSPKPDESLNPKVLFNKKGADNLKTFLTN